MKVGVLGTGDVGRRLGGGFVSRGHVEPGKPPGLAVGHTDSGGEQVQRWVPDARVVKAFNIVGNQHMIDPDFPGGPPTCSSAETMQMRNDR